MAYDYLLQVMKDRGIKKAHLAHDCGIAESTVYNLFAGRQYLYPKYRKAISDYIGIRPEILFEEESNG